MIFSAIYIYIFCDVSASVTVVPFDIASCGGLTAGEFNVASNAVR